VSRLKIRTKGGSLSSKDTEIFLDGKKLENVIDFNLEMSVERYSTISMTIHVDEVDVEEYPTDVEVKKLSKFDILGV
jgi:hypothetical protein